MKSILFVCLGNICRSPAAEEIMRVMIKNRKLENLFDVDSAGLGDWHVGQLPDQRMMRHGDRHGYHIRSRARLFTPDDFDNFHLIVGMDQNNVDEIKAMARSPYDYNKVVGMAKFLRHHPMHRSVPDPYYGGDAGFELVIELLEDACEGLLDHLLTRR
jgi:protein-tyrosine phosphatase